MSLRKKAAVAVATALLLGGGGMSVPALAAETTCIPFDPTGVVCDTSIPTHRLSQGDPADEYKGFIFTTSSYPFNNAMFDGNWTQLTRINGGLSERWMVPRRIGATVKLPKAGVWTDPQGIAHNIDATFTVLDTNGGIVGEYSNAETGVGLLDLTAATTTYWDTSTNGGKVSEAEPTPTDDNRLVGITVKVSFTYSDTGKPVPDTFKGLTGFADLDGVTDTSIPADDPQYIEGVEPVDGFDGLWLSDDNHLGSFGYNGYRGTDECGDQANVEKRHAQQHMFTAAFSGPDFTVRYSQGAYKSGYAMVFAAPLLKNQLVYKVTAHAVDTDGNEIKAPWTVADGLRVNGTYNLSGIPAIEGYEYVGPSEDSAPLSGSVTNDEASGDKAITLVYRKLAAINYNGNGGSGTVNGETVNAGTNVDTKPNGFNRVGYTFTGWNTKSDGTGTPYKPGDEINLTADLTLYAQWERMPGSVNWVKTDKTTGDILAGSEWRLDGPDGQSVTIIDNKEADTDPEDGGFIVSDLDWGNWTLTETKAPTGHDPLPQPIAFTIDAQHTTVNLGDVENTRTPATVTYDANGGKGETAPYTGMVGDTPQASSNEFTAPNDCTKFSGWNTKVDGTGTAYKEGDVLPPLTGDLTLYAQWENDPSCQVMPEKDDLADTGAAIGIVASMLAAAAALGAGILTFRHARRNRH